MRVTKGKLNRQRLRIPTDGEVRPTARRLRETLFEFLGRRIAGARWLDLCAGSGAVGIEALSRGASFATFVERETEACALIEANLTACGARQQAEVLRSEAASFLRQTGATETWDIAFFDPPYASDYASVLTLFGAGAALTRKGGVLVVEHRFDHKLADSLGVLRRWRLIKQGQSCLSFYERRRG